MKWHSIIIIIIVILCSDTVYGQKHHRKEYTRRFAAGVKTGISLTDMRLSSDYYDIYKSSIRPYGSFGAFFLYKDKSGFAFRPELVLGGRGSSLSCHDVKYAISSTCLNLRMNLEYHLYINRTTKSVYFVAAPGWNTTLGGWVKYSSEEIESLKMNLSRSNMHIHDMNVFVGMGFDMQLLISRRSFYLAGEVGYNFYLTNSFTADEQTNNINILNNLIYSHPNTGRRVFNGIEASLRIGIPFGKTIH